jgi:hypothetical protein
MTETLFLCRGTPSALGSEAKYRFQRLNADRNKPLKLQMLATGLQPYGL